MYVVVAVVSFPSGRNESCQTLRQVRLLSSTPICRKTPWGGEASHLSFLSTKLTSCRSRKQIILAVASDDFQELLDSHNQELTMDKLVEINEQNKTKELESLDPGQSEE
ncbi:hypothetical protein TNCV_2751581 [Trichonephila clavipes]|nr:hypothetical protein TNCV_2751581 [Trichonephila clavipes]